MHQNEAVTKEEECFFVESAQLLLWHAVDKMVASEMGVAAAEKLGQDPRQTGSEDFY